MAEQEVVWIQCDHCGGEGFVEYSDYEHGLIVDTCANCEAECGWWMPVAETPGLDKDGDGD